MINCLAYTSKLLFIKNACVLQGINHSKSCGNHAGSIIHWEWVQFIMATPGNIDMEHKTLLNWSE